MFKKDRVMTNVPYCQYGTVLAAVRGSFMGQTQCDATLV
jgi:hypothetical protein